MATEARTPYYPDELRYTKEHEWVRAQGDGTALVGITFFAQDQLGDVVYLNLPAPGSSLAQTGKLGEVESVKAVSDIFAPVSGQVMEVNQEVVAHPELVNQDPYGKGWLLRVRLSDPKELAKLMAAKQYQAMLAAEGH
ncbi:MAG: glycine cleavage system protein GcvH [Chloroflexi bacterium]|nr:glycine cleavage system protein GcvH [Chloroflexota bacterium]